MKKLLLFCISLCFFSIGRAQFDVQFSNYWALSGFYNPAYAGQTDRLNLYGTYSMQLLGFTNAPKSMYFGADMPFKFLGRKHGVGAGFFSEGIGLFRNQRYWVQYSFKMNLFGGNLGIGLQPGMLSVGFNPDGINFGDGDEESTSSTDDPAFPTSSVTGSSFDLTAGIYYSHSLFYVGFSASHITAPTVRFGDTNELKVDPTLYFTGGCNIKTKSPLISIQPSVLMMTDLLSFKANLTTRVSYTYEQKTFYGGLGYSPGISVSFLFGGRIKDISLGYAYEMFTSKIGALNGSHDLVVGYSLDLNFMAKSKNKHKSIRIL